MNTHPKPRSRQDRLDSSFPKPSQSESKEATQLRKNALTPNVYREAATKGFGAIRTAHEDVVALGNDSIQTSVSSERHAGLQSAPRQRHLPPGLTRSTREIVGIGQASIQSVKLGGGNGVTPRMDDREIGRHARPDPRLTAILEWEPSQEEGLLGNGKESLLSHASHPVSKIGGNPLSSFQEARNVKSDRPIRVAGVSLNKHAKSMKAEGVEVDFFGIEREDGRFGKWTTKDEGNHDDFEAALNDFFISENVATETMSGMEQAESSPKTESEKVDHFPEPDTVPDSMDVGQTQDSVSDSEPDEAESDEAKPISLEDNVVLPWDTLAANRNTTAAEASKSDPTKTEGADWIPCSDSYGGVDSDSYGGVECKMALQREDGSGTEPPSSDESILPITLPNRGSNDDRPNPSPPAKRQKCTLEGTKTDTNLAVLMAMSSELGLPGLENQSIADESHSPPPPPMILDIGDKSHGGAIVNVETQRSEPILPVPLLTQDSWDKMMNCDACGTDGQTDVPPQSTETHDCQPGSFWEDYSSRFVGDIIEPVFSEDSDGQEQTLDPGHQDVAEGKSDRNSMALSFSVGESDDLCGLVDSEEDTFGKLASFGKSRDQNGEDPHVGCATVWPGERNHAERREIDEFEIPLPQGNSSVDVAMEDSQGWSDMVENFSPPSAFDAIKRVFRVDNESFDLRKFLESQGIVRDRIAKG
ncbi:hypothetical protein BSKO_04271 [Bryopsis sp. KO-2023]|nr:hypothetical protein BSKO_04271 [Bryopsis sp. KO-2023]